jgi:hypothetical protein
LRSRVYSIILKGKRRTLTWWWWWRRFWDYEFEYWIQHPRPVSVRIRWWMAALTTCCLVSGTAIWREREKILCGQCYSNCFKMDCFLFMGLNFLSSRRICFLHLLYMWIGFFTAIRSTLKVETFYCLNWLCEFRLIVVSIWVGSYEGVIFD